MFLLHFMPPGESYSAAYPNASRKHISTTLNARVHCCALSQNEKEHTCNVEVVVFSNKDSQTIFFCDPHPWEGAGKIAFITAFSHPCLGSQFKTLLLWTQIQLLLLFCTTANSTANFQARQDIFQCNGIL